MKRGHSLSPMALMGLIIVAVLLNAALSVDAQEPKLQVEPGKGTYGLQIFIKGSGFAPGSQIQIEAFGQTIAPQANSAGEFLVIAYAPTDQTKFKPGSFKITAKDNQGGSAEASFVLEELVSPVAGGLKTPGAEATTAASGGAAATAPSQGGMSDVLTAIAAGFIALVILVAVVLVIASRLRQKVTPAGARPAFSTPSARPYRPPEPARPAPPESPTATAPPAPSSGTETTLLMPSLPKLSSRPTLQIISGEGAGTVYTLEQKTTVIGRGEDCDIIINHPMVSRHHAKIVRVGPSYYIHDLQSTNSTLVNGRRIDQHVLQPDDEIQIGVTLLLFQQPQSEE